MEGEINSNDLDSCENITPDAKAARDHFITVGYGKFDLIETRLPLEILLHGKPRVVKKMISEQFGLSASEINDDTFWSWLRRIRKSNVRNIPRNKNGRPQNESLEGGEQPDQWKSFTPSNPVMEKEVTQAIIKLVKPTEN